MTAALTSTAVGPGAASYPAWLEARLDEPLSILAGGGAWGPGLIGVLAIVAGAILLVRGVYPREVFELLVGLNRWVWRVAAYVALMRDEYPPCRSER